MTKQAKSADDILDIFHNEPVPDGFTKDTQPTALIRTAAVLMYRKAESELLPIINQQAEEIETLKAELSTKNTALGIDKEKILESMLGLEKEKDALEEEIEKLKAENAKISALGDTANQFYMEEVKKVSALQSRFDELVKSLEGIQVEGIEEEGLIYRVVAYSKLQSLVTKAKGQENG